MANNTAAAVVRVHNLVKEYGNFQAVRGVDFTVREGECFGLLGPNGAGKSTTIRTICCLTDVTAGTVEVFGLPAYPGHAAIKRQIGVVAQDDHLDPDLTVKENLEIQGRFYGQDRHTAQARSVELLIWMQLEGKAHDQVRTLSGGMRRRLAIARALVAYPRLLVLDEPTTGLDPQARQLVWGKLRELKASGVTILLTTHYMEEAERLADHLVIIDHGKILERGHPTELIRRIVGRECLELTGRDVEMTRWTALLSTFPQCRFDRQGELLTVFAPDLEPVVQSLKNHGLLPQQYYRRRAGLEDVFLRLTGRELRE